MSGKPSPEVAARRARSLQMRAAGVTYAQIAEQEPSYKTPAAACDDVTRALKARKDWLDEQTALFVALEVERLDGLQRRVETVIANAAAKGDQWMVLRGVDRLVRVSERRGTLLGMDLARVRDHAPPAPAAKDADDIDEIAARRAKRRRGAAG